MAAEGGSVIGLDVEGEKGKCWRRNKAGEGHGYKVKGHDCRALRGLLPLSVYG